MKKILLLATAFLVIGVACKDKKEPPQPVQHEIEEPVQPEPDTISQQIEEPEPIEPAEPDKYFLIAASFQKQSNAESFKNQLNDKGFQAEVITREWGPNSEFYKVSYMGFSDRKEAIERMQQERNQPDKEDVWVLVKK